MKNANLTIALSGCCIAVLLCASEASSFAQTQPPTPPVAQQTVSATSRAQTEPATAEVKALRELHGIKLGMPRNRVKDALGRPTQTAEQIDEFKLDGDDLLTVRYDPQGAVNIIQLYCTDAKRAPVWTDVIGDAQIEQQPNGSKHARKIVPAENFWVTMFQSQSGALTTITMSRQNN